MKTNSGEEKILDMTKVKEDERLENLKQIIALIKKDPDLEGSFIQDLLEIMSLASVPEIKKQTKEGEEKEVGEMNALDNGLVALCEHYAELEKNLNAEKKEKISPERNKFLKKELSTIRGRFELLQKFYQENLRERLEDPDQTQDTRFEIRTGGKIVATKNHHFLPGDYPTFLREAVGVCLIKTELIP